MHCELKKTNRRQGITGSSGMFDHIMNQEINRRNIPKSLSGGEDFEDRADRPYEHQPHPISGASADVSTTELCDDHLSAKVSNEMEAARKVIKSLEGLDGDSSLRVMSYVIDLLDMHI
jgi:hypothetical protein